MRKRFPIINDIYLENPLLLIAFLPHTSIYSNPKQSVSNLALEIQFHSSTRTCLIQTRNKFWLLLARFFYSRAKPSSSGKQVKMRCIKAQFFGKIIFLSQQKICLKKPQRSLNGSLKICIPRYLGRYLMENLVSHIPCSPA